LPDHSRGEPASGARLGPVAPAISVINIRKLAALDLAFLGTKFIIAEFALGVLGPATLGLFTLLRSHSAGGTLFGLYLVSLGVNYVPLLLHAISIVRDGTAQAEIADDIDDRKQLFAKYRRGSLLLLLPLAVPIVAFAQWHRSHAAE
jgi:hypothetical protein